MSADDPTPVVLWDELIASTDYHDVGEFSRGEDRRIYRLRVVPEGAELWRVTESPEQPDRSIKEALFKSSEEAGAFLEEMQRALIAGGWRRC
jgi:hypothetical protein